MDDGCEEYTRQVLEAYRKTPGTSGTVRRPDRVLAGQLYQRGVSDPILSGAVRILPSGTLKPAAALRSLEQRRSSGGNGTAETFLKPPKRACEKIRLPHGLCGKLMVVARPLSWFGMVPIVPVSPPLLRCFRGAHAVPVQRWISGWIEQRNESWKPMAD